MTNYLTAQGVQSFSITIPTGADSATATINAVGVGAFIPTPSDNSNQTTSNASTSSARVELTNSTTVTAYRNTLSATETVTMVGVVVDGDTANLIKSVQFGTVTIGSLAATGTASISAVTNNNTAVFYLGATSQEITSYSTAFSYGSISLSGTTLTGTRGAATTTTALVIGFCVVEFQGAALNQAVQNVSYNNTENIASKAVTLASSVNLNNAMIAYGGWSAGAGISTANARPNMRLTGTSTVTFAWNAASNALRIMNCCVIEFVAGVLNSNVQRGTISLTAQTSNTATISSVNTANTIPNWLGNNASSGTQTLSKHKLVLTNATTLTESATAAATGVGSYEVVEFPAFISATYFDPIWFGMEA